MQESLMLRRGRGRGYNSGGNSRSHDEVRVPIIPSFPFEQRQFFAPRNVQNSVFRGLSNYSSQRLCVNLNAASGLSNPGSGLFNPVRRELAINCGGNGPRFPYSEREEVRAPFHCHQITSLPKPRPNTLTQQEWDVLNQNGRPSHKGVCAVVCCCTFGEGDTMQRIFSFCCSGPSHSQHTEKKVIEQVIMYENGSGRELRKVIFISSRSPCIPCAQDIITFVKSRGFSMNLYFTALQKQINPSRNGISLLASYGIPMRIIDNYIWSYLTSLLAISDGKARTNFSDGGRVDKIYRKAWDEVWSQQLGAVLHQDLPNILNCQNLFDKFNHVKKIMISKEQTIT